MTKNSSNAGKVAAQATAPQPMPTRSFRIARMPVAGRSVVAISAKAS